jgi:hypothetical protein
MASNQRSYLDSEIWSKDKVKNVTTKFFIKTLEKPKIVT